MTILRFTAAVLIGSVATSALAGHGCPASSAHQASAWKSAPVTAVSHHESAPDIVDTAVSAGDFGTLVAAVKAAGLVEALKGEGPLTVFAPTDEAFAKLPAGTVETLLKPENKDQLTKILTYHVVPGRVLAKDVVGLRSAKTLQGSEVAIGVGGGRVFVDGARVVKTDIVCGNGVIHVVDSVLLPAE